MAEKIIETVELRVTAPKTAKQLAGLDHADAKLASIEKRILRINTLLAKPVELQFNLKNLGQAEKFLRESIERRGGSASGSRVTGDIRDVKSVAASLGVTVKQFTTAFAASVDKVVAGAKSLYEVGSNNARFSSGAVASRAALAASKTIDSQRQATLQSLLTQAGTAGAPLPVKVVATGSGSGTAGSDAKEATKVNPNRPYDPPRGTRTQTQTTIPPDPAGVKRLKESFVDAAGKTADYYSKLAADGSQEGGKTVIRENQAARKKQAEREAKDQEKLANQMADARLKARAQTYAGQVAYGRGIAPYSAEAQALRQEAVQRAQQTIEERAQQAGLASRKKFAADTEKARQDADKRRLEAELSERDKAQRAARNLRAKQLGEAELAKGALRTRSTTRDNAGGMSVMDVFSRRDGNRMVETTISFGKAGAAISQVTRELKAVRAEAGAAGKGFLQNTAQVTSWAISVGALYGTLGLVRASITSLGRTDAQLARLSQVFNGVGGSARQLAIDVLQLASANGRSAEEGLASAIQWSRLGLTRAEVNEAVRVSLVAANVAELTASDATEKLSGIMAAYNLRVRDLAGVLGQLNAVSNEYNVTNAAMLDGISKTAGVARQAGLPLAELIGLIGGTVGSAAQSGASIGTAIKSITVALSNPRLQQALRNEFKVEVSRGASGEIKDLSTLFNELFIAYQRLNNAQRQNLLFQVAGKTQASRLASVLDNYVRSQVLAINAQLNLNSAEAENAKIKATLQARLTGLIAEFERFTAIQGQRGGGFALGQAVDSLRTGLAVMNLPGVNVAVSGLIVLLGAAVAKLALTAVTMREVGTKGGFVINSLQGVANAFTGLGVTANRVVRNFTATKASATLLGRVMGTEVSTGVAGASRSLEAFGLRSLRAARASGGLALGLRASALAARTLSVALVAVWEFALPLLVVAGAVWGINKAFNATTDAIAEADRRAQGFGDSARAAGEAAKSAAQAARLMDTLATVLPGADDDSRKRWLRDLGQVDQGLAHQLDLMLQQGRVTEATNLLLRKRAQFQQQEITNRATELANLGAEEESIRASIAKLSRRDNDESRQAISRFEARLGEIQGERVGKVAQGLSDNERDLQQSRGADQQVLLFAERTKLAAQSLSEFYKSTPQASPVDRLNADVAALSAEVELYDRLLVKLKEDSAEGFANQVLLDRTAKLRNEIRANQLEVGKLNEVIGINNEPGDFQAMVDRRNRRNKLVAESAAKAAELRAGEAQLQGSGFDPVRAQAQQQELLDARDKAARELAARNDAENRRRVQFQADFDATLARAQAERGAYNFGASETERLQNQLRGADEIVARNRAQGDPLLAADGPGRFSAEIRILDAVVSKQQLLLEIEKQRGALAQQYNQQMREASREFQKTLLTANSGQLLKTVSALRLAAGNGGRGLSAGQFLSLDSSVREQVQRGFGPGRPGQFNPELMQIQRDQRNLGPRLSDADFVQQFRGPQNEARAIYERFQEYLKPPAQGTFSDETLRALSASADGAAKALAQIPAVVEALVRQSLGRNSGGVFQGEFAGRR